MRQKDKFNIKNLLIGSENSQILFVGSLNCVRHKGGELIELMNKKRLSILCPTMSDFSTGKYLDLIINAIKEISEERNTKDFTIMYGCQCHLLSTDFELIKESLKDINIKIHDNCHLLFEKGGKDEKTLEKYHTMHVRY